VSLLTPSLGGEDVARAEGEETATGEGPEFGPYQWHEGPSKSLPLTDRVALAAKRRLRDAVSSPPTRKKALRESHHARRRRAHECMKEVRCDSQFIQRCNRKE